MQQPKAKEWTNKLNNKTMQNEHKLLKLTFTLPNVILKNQKDNTRVSTMERAVRWRRNQQS